RTPPRMIPPQLADHRLDLRADLVRARLRPPGPVFQRPQAALVIPPDPGMHAPPRHPEPGRTSVTGTPALTSRTARYRCSTTDTSTSADPGLPPPDAANDEEQESRITAPVNHLLGLRWASTETGHV